MKKKVVWVMKLIVAVETEEEFESVEDFNASLSSREPRIEEVKSTRGIARIADSKVEFIDVEED